MSHRRVRPAANPPRYGLLVGTIRDGVFDPKGQSPHYEIWVIADRDYRIAVNVQSVDGSEVLAYFDPTFTLPTKANLPARAAGNKGFTALKTGPGGEGLDYLRDGLFPLDSMKPIPDIGSGVSLANLLDGQVERAKADGHSCVLAFGDFFQDQGADPTFHFAQETGIHDIHMNQGNGGKFASDNRVNGDGALFIRYAGGETVALFTRFTIQDIPTDPRTGAPADP
jgi:uncharacterized protein YukJ